MSAGAPTPGELYQEAADTTARRWSGWPAPTKPTRKFGWVVLMAAFVQVHPPHLGWRLAVANASAVLIFWIFWSESRWRVRKLQHQIDEIDVIPRER